MDYVEIAREQIVSGLEEFNASTDYPVKFSLCFVRRLAVDAIEAKAGLIEILSKSPYWQEDILAVRYPLPQKEEIPWSKVRVSLRRYFCLEHGINEKIYRLVFSALKKTLAEISLESGVKVYLNNEEGGAFTQEEYIEYIFTPCGRGWETKKPSRILMACCKKLGLVDADNFNRWFTGISDLLSTKTPKYLYISVNPAHFLTMSNPKEQKGRCQDVMTSCHSLNIAERNRQENRDDCTYAAGNSGYARDGVTMIAFTCPNGREKNSLNSLKTNRQLFHYENGVLLQNRPYTTRTNEDYGGTEDIGQFPESDQFRLAVEKVISAGLNMENKWVKKEYADYYHKFWEHSDFRGFADWNVHRFLKLCNMVYLKAIVNAFDIEEKDVLMTIGEDGLCLECGHSLSCANNNPLCENCYQQGIPCEYCGATHQEEELKYVYDYGYVCEDCLNGCNGFIYCEYHERWEYCPNEYETVNNYGTVCEDALYSSGMFTYCEDCGEWYLTEDCYWIEGEGKYVCGDCLDDYYQCSDCGEYFSEDGIEVGDNGKNYCRDCIENHSDNVA